VIPDEIRNQILSSLANYSLTIKSEISRGNPVRLYIPEIFIYDIENSWGCVEEGFYYCISLLLLLLGALALGDVVGHFNCADDDMPRSAAAVEAS
jgi:hypothetical protein